MYLQIKVQIESGKFVSLYGSSGAGKTSVLRMLAGFTKPDNGCIKMNDVVWFDASKRINMQPQQRSIGFVFQDYALFPNMTVKEHLEYATNDAAWIERLLIIGKLETLTQHKPEHLSGGQQQRLAILRAMAIKPNLLLMDEPFSAIDAEMKLQLIGELRKLFDELKTTVLIVSHNQQELDGLTNLEIIIS